METPDLPKPLRDLIERAMVDQLQSPAPSAPPWQPRPGQTREEWIDEVARVRAQHDAFALENAQRYGFLGDRDDPVGSVGYHEVPVKGGVISARVYHPAQEAEPPPALVLLHGGGWWMGGGAQGYRLGDGMCRMLCRGLGAVIVNVDYRLAPEHRFPVQLHDVRDTIAWLRRGDGPTIDADRIGVAGTSSGGNVAAALTLLLRDQGEPALALQLLIAPALDVSGDIARLTEDPVLAEGIEILRHFYLGEFIDPATPYVSPLQAESLTGLPPAVVVTGDFDPLSPIAQAYVQRLREAAVPVEHATVPATHTIAAPQDWRLAEEKILTSCRRILA